CQRYLSRPEPLARLGTARRYRRRPLSNLKPRTCRPTPAATAAEPCRQGWTSRVNKSLPSGLRAGPASPNIPPERAVWALCWRCVTFVQQRLGGACARLGGTGATRPVGE